MSQVANSGRLPQDLTAEGILFICTANRARSPFMHLVLKDGLRRAGCGHLRIESAGIDTRAGTPIDVEVGKELDRRGIFSSSFRSREIEPSSISAANLILTATRQHRDFVGTLVPTARDRLFTLSQFYRLLTIPESGAVANGRVGPSDLVEIVRANRGRSGVSVGSDDIQDPVGKGKRVYRSCFSQMDSALDLLINRLTGSELPKRNNQSGDSARSSE